MNTPPPLHCFSGGWGQGAGSCQGLLQQKCDQRSLPCCRETSVAASSQPIALINDSAPRSPFQKGRGRSPAVNPSLKARPSLKAGPSHSFWEAQMWLPGSPSSSPQALQHCLGHWWPGLGGREVPGLRRLPCPLAAPSRRDDIPCHTRPATFREKLSPMCSVRREARPELPRRDRGRNTGRWVFPARAARLAAVPGEHRPTARGGKDSGGVPSRPALLQQGQRGPAGGGCPPRHGQLQDFCCSRWPVPAGEMTPSRPQERRRGAAAAAAADTGSSGGFLHALPRCPCSTLFIFPLPRLCPDLTCVS